MLLLSMTASCVFEWGDGGGNGGGPEGGRGGNALTLAPFKSDSTQSEYGLPPAEGRVFNFSASTPTVAQAPLSGTRRLIHTSSAATDHQVYVSSTVLLPYCQL